MDQVGGKLMEFDRFLREKRLVPEDKVHYYCRWADDFLHGIGYRFDRIDQHSLAAFVDRLRKGARPEWQLAQAEDAARIFIVNFLGVNTQPRPVGQTPSTMDGSWDEALAKMTECLRLKHYSYKTEQTYIEWVKRFKAYVGGNCPRDIVPGDVKDYMAHLAMDKKVSASTQNQAFNSILFFFRHVLERDIGDMADNVRARRGRRLPTVFSVQEVFSIISQLEGTAALMAKLMYGCGLRLNECLRLRVNNVDLDRMTLHIHAAKGDKDRLLPLPVMLKDDLRHQIGRLRDLHEKDIAMGHGEVYMPDALARKYPNASRAQGWQWLFPAKKLSVDPRSGKVMRHHLLDSAFQKIIKRAIEKSGIDKQGSCHTFRHSYATHLFENGTDIKVIQELLGHKSIETTMIYTHLAEKKLVTVESPLDRLFKKGVGEG